MSNLGSISWRFLIRRPGKAFGAIVGIALGIAMIVSAVSAGGAARVQLDRSMETALGSADLIISHTRPFDESHVEKAIKGLPVEAQTRQLNYPARIASGHDRTVNVAVTGLNPKETEGFWRLSMADGRFAVGGGNVVVSGPLARQLDIRVGDTLELYAGAGPARVRLSGILSETGLGNKAGPAVYMNLSDARLRQGLTKDKISDVYVKLRPGASVAGIKKTLSDRLGADIKVGRTPASSEYSLNMVTMVRQVLMAFAVFALAVGTLLIYQSSSVSAAQMIPTLALMKSLGATRRQLVKIFLLESVLVGGTASLSGVALGYFMAAGMTVPVGAVMGGDLRPLSPSPAFLAEMVLLGIAVAVAATFMPINKSLLVSVAEIMRGPDMPARYNTGGTVRWLAALIEPWLQRFQPAAIVPVRNLVRNFRRLRFTAVCITACLAMIIAIQLGAGAVKGLMHQYFAIYSRQTYVFRAAVMAGGDTTSRMSLTKIDKIEKIQGVGRAVPFYLSGAHFRGHAVAMQSGAARETDDWVLAEGERAEAAARFHSGGWTAVSTSFAKRNGIGVNDTIDLEAGGVTRRFRVAAVVVNPREGVVVYWPDLRRYFHIMEADEFEVFPAAGADYDEVGDRLQEFADRDGLYLFTSRQFTEQLEGFIGAFAAFLTAITGSVLVLSALALANIMFVGALERRRLLGVLRAQGMTRRQLARLLISENMTVGLMSLPAGLGFGFILGQLLIWFIREQLGATMSGIVSLWSLPAGAISILVVLYLTAILPARRAASIPVAEALRYE